jgi:predicted GIY-YIG superfamily endonuclease
LRQHNGEIKGGAKYTTRRLSGTARWQRICSVSRFPDQRAALQFEYRWKSLSRKKVYHALRPLERRLAALGELLRLERPTRLAQPFSLYRPLVNWEPEQFARRWTFYRHRRFPVRLARLVKPTPKSD